MLIRFFVENYLCFNSQAEFSMQAGKTTLLRHHVIRGQKRSDINILKCAVIYGANASGKTNLIKSMKFATDFIIKGTQTGDQIPIRNFKLDPSNSKKPSKFQFDFTNKGKMYSYGFELDRKCIHSEWLYEITKTKETLLFRRGEANSKDYEINYKNIGCKNDEEEQFLKFIWKGTRPNQLFLTETMQRNATHFLDVYSWFRNKLIFIFPESFASGIELKLSEGEATRDDLLENFSLFDTGISNIITKKYKLDELKDIPVDVKNKISNDLHKKGDLALLCSISDNERYTVQQDKDGTLTALKLFAKHKLKGSNEEIVFDINEESDGSQRLIDLVPALTNLLKADCTVMIDEIDRSLHPHLSWQFLNIFLSKSGNRNSQLIVTTHESTLLDLKLLRRDEIWFVEKNKDGEAHVYSLEEYKPRFDKDIRGGYLLGRFGGIPYIRKNISIQ